MKWISIFFLIFACFREYNYAQNSYNLDNGLVFTANYEPPIIISDKIISYTPTLAEIKLAEKILIEKYNIDLSSDSRFTTFKQIPDIQFFFKKYKRQYLGYLNKQNEKIIIIHLLNFAKRKRANKNFIDWREKYFVGFGEFYEKNVKTYVANLDRYSLALF